MMTTDELTISLGELKARHREEHLCFRCEHHVVCGMARALDPNLLVTISNCLAFESAEAPESKEDEEAKP